MNVLTALNRDWGRLPPNRTVDSFGSTIISNEPAGGNSIARSIDGRRRRNWESFWQKGWNRAVLRGDFHSPPPPAPAFGCCEYMITHTYASVYKYKSGEKPRFRRKRFREREGSHISTIIIARAPCYLFFHRNPTKRSKHRFHCLLMRVDKSH